MRTSHEDVSSALIYGLNSPDRIWPHWGVFVCFMRLLGEETTQDGLGSLWTSRMRDTVIRLRMMDDRRVHEADPLLSLR